MNNIEIPDYDSKMVMLPKIEININSNLRVLSIMETALNKNGIRLLVSSNLLNLLYLNLGTCL